MVHQRQRLPFGFKPRDHLFGIHAELDNLQRDAAPHRFLLLGHVNHAAAAFAELLEEFVLADSATRFFAYGSRGPSDCILEKVRPPFLGVCF
jgi:hypothetical protein